MNKTIRITLPDERLKARLDARAREQSFLTNQALYYSRESLPFRHATACMQIALFHSTKASAAYAEVKEAWGRPDCLEAMNDFLTDLLDTNTWAARVRKVKKLYDMGYSGLPKSECHGWDWIHQKHQDSADFQYLVDRVFEFIKEGFNREAEKVEGIYKVVASEEVPWLFLAANTFSCAEFCKIKLADWNKYGKVEIGGKVYDFEDIMRNKATHRMHRGLVKAYKKCGHTLKHDRVLLKAADQWYKCRVSPGSIEAYLQELADLDLKGQKPRYPDQGRISNDIAACDDATGYPRHK